MFLRFFKTPFTIVVIIWLVWLAYLLDTIRHDGFYFDPFTRVVFSAKNFWYDWYGVQVKTYIMTSDQVSNLEKIEATEEPKSWSYQKDSKREQLYYVIRIYGHAIYGQLLCRFPTGEKYKYIICTDVSGTVPVKNIIVPCPSKIYDISKKVMNTRWNFSNNTLNISTRWTNLYFCK